MANKPLRGRAQLVELRDSLAADLKDLEPAYNEYMEAKASVDQLEKIINPPPPRKRRSRAEVEAEKAAAPAATSEQLTT